MGALEIVHHIFKFSGLVTFPATIVIILLLALLEEVLDLNLAFVFGSVIDYTTPIKCPTFP